jgi:hypothetical protein
VKPSLRKVVADSYIAAVAITMLLLWSLDEFIRSVPYVWQFATRGVSYSSGVLRMGYPDWLLLALGYLIDILVKLGSAWLLARWAYGVGPLNSLGKCCAKLAGRDYV